MKKKYIYKFVLIILIICSLASTLFYFINEIPNSLKRGESHESLENQIFINIKDSLKYQLGEYKLNKGHYPIISSKRFLDSLKRFDFISPIYIYQDSLGCFSCIGDSTTCIYYSSHDGKKYVIKLLRNDK